MGMRELDGVVRGDVSEIFDQHTSRRREAVWEQVGSELRLRGEHAVHDDFDLSC